MRYRTFEADKYGRIIAYPSLDAPGEKKTGFLRIMMKKLGELIRGLRSKLLTGSLFFDGPC